MSKPETFGELLSIRKASMYTGAGEGTVKKWVDLGYVPAVVLPGGTHMRIRKSDLDELIGGLETYGRKADR